MALNIVFHRLTWTLLCLCSILGTFSVAITVPREHSKSVHINVTSPTVIRVPGAYRFSEDSGMCETTPGVKTYSGYIQISQDQEMFFWFFEARNNPKEAPMAVWLNGGPACSSLIGLFTGNGPCTIDENASSKLNPYSWNEYAHMLYIDQPIGTGFSYGKVNAQTTEQAASEIWNFFQLLLDTPPFLKYKRELSFWGESYSGRYISLFGEHFNAQNQLIKAKKIKGKPIELGVLGINNGWHDPYVQMASYPDFAQAKYNGMFDLVDQSTLYEVKTALTKKDGCLESLMKCSKGGNKEICQNVNAECDAAVLHRLIGNQDVYYFPNNESIPTLSDSFLDYLEKPEVAQAIGADSSFAACAEEPYEEMKKGGDIVRSSMPSLAKLLNNGIKTLIWAGDRDFICNWLGVHRAMEGMKWKYQDEFRTAPWQRLEMWGTTVGTYKTAGPLTFLKLFGAGHAAVSYRPDVSLEIFKQIMRREDLHSVPKP